MYHRINTTANNGDATFTGIRELEFNTELPSDRYDVSDGKTYAYTGANLIPNGTFDTDTTGWGTDGTSINSVGGVCELVTTADGQSVFQGVSTIAGRHYVITADLLSANSDIYVSAGSSLYTSDVSASPATLSVGFVAEGSSTSLFLRGRAAGTFNFDNVSCISQGADEVSINRVYLGELTTDTNGDIINNTIVNYTPNKLKTTDAELHGDLIVRGEIANPQVATAWVNFDGTQNPPLIRSSYNVKDVVDLGAGKYRAIFEEPMDNIGYSVSLIANKIDATEDNNGTCTLGTTTRIPSKTEFPITCGVPAAPADCSFVQAIVFGGKS